MPGRTAATPGTRPWVQSIPVEAIRASPYQPRGPLAAESIEELAASIREHGVLQPIVVRPVEDGFEVVAGERRWRAARAAGLDAVPAVVRELSDREAAVLALVENLQREDLPFFEEAEGYRRLLEEFRLSQEDLARELGRSQPAIANKLRLLKLEPEVRRRVCEAGLSERHARALLRLEGEAERLAAVEAFVRGNLNARQAEAWVERRLRAGGQVRRRAGKDAPAAVLRCLEAVRELAQGLRRAGLSAEVAEEEDGRGWVIRLRIGRPEARGAGSGRRG
jgi:ParB family chromosome partitioning protein